VSVCVVVLFLCGIHTASVATWGHVRGCESIRDRSKHQLSYLALSLSIHTVAWHLVSSTVLSADTAFPAQSGPLKAESEVQQHALYLDKNLVVSSLITVVFLLCCIFQ